MAEIGFNFLRTLNACDDKANGADVAFVLGVREVPGASTETGHLGRISWRSSFFPGMCWDSASY
jgi:hypothetical protein